MVGDCSAGQSDRRLEKTVEVVKTARTEGVSPLAGVTPKPTQSGWWDRTACGMSTEGHFFEIPGEEPSMT
jgi:hypothetical protein